MINTLQKRPQSKSYRSNFEPVRPITRNNDQQQAQKCFQMGKQHHNRNDIEKAQKFYLEAIIHNPAHFKSYCNLGLCYKLRGQYPNSIQAYKKSLSITPLDPITNYNLANVYRLIGDEQKSIAHYLVVINLKEKQGVDVKSLYLDSYNNLGICYKNIENYTQAIECFEKIFKEKPSEQIVKFNLAVCYLRVVRKMVKNTKNQNAMLAKENISKTTNLFQQVLKTQSKNEVAILALIQLQTLSNKQNENIKKCVSELEELLKQPDASSFLKQEGSKIKAHCLNLLAKYEESAEQYRKAIQKKKEQEDRKMAQQKEKQKALQAKQKSQTTNKPQQPKVVTSKILEPAPQPVQTTTQQQIMNPQPVLTQINPKEIFQTMLSSLLQNIKTIIGDPTILSQHKNLGQTLSTLVQELVKQHLANNKDKKLVQRIRKELSIVGCSILGQNLIDKQFFAQAYDTYMNYFLQSNLNTTVTKSTLFLETHRAIASVLTSLGQSQKAIEHYQIISQQFTEKNIHDNDPLQQLHSGLAVNYESQGLHEKAIKQFKQAIRLNPNNYIFYYNLGYCQHCAGMNSDAVSSYSKFLEEIQKDATLETESKQSYILQALISIFICSQGTTEEKISKCTQIENKINEFSGSQPQNALKLIDQPTLMHYYLLACDLYEQVIFGLQKSPKQASKIHKEKLFIIYINLLELPNCPDRDQILINCGNLLFEEREFFGALQFYQKVSKSKTQVFNIIALTLMNVNEHERAINCMQFAIQCDKTNKIYEINYEIMKWAYGLEITNKENLLWTKYPCQCDLQFDSRVEYAKSLIIKLTTLIEEEISQTSSVQNMTLGSIFVKLLHEKQEPHLWKESESLLKHDSLKKHIQQHSVQVHNDGKQHSIDPTFIKEILEIISQQTNTSEQTIKKTLNQLIEKLNNSSNKKSPDYLNILEQSLALFIFLHTKDSTKQNTLKQVLQSKTTTINTYDLIFADSVTQNAVKYPEKNYAVVYSSIELKLQNLIQSLLSWNTMLEEQFVYLLKIVEAIAYKSQLKSPVSIDYNFTYCKNVQNCEKCFKKACFVLSKLFNIDCKQNFMTSLNSESSLGAQKKAIYTAFVSKFGKNLENVLSSTPGKDSKTLSLKLSEQTLPLQMQINFSSQNDFEKFLKQLCTQLTVKQPTYDKADKQLYLTFNKLVRVRCTWKETDFTEQLISTVVKSTLGMKQCAIEFFDQELLKQWAGEQALKPFLAQVFDVSTFLK